MLAPDFLLPSTQGAQVSLSDIVDGAGQEPRPFLVQFICNHCPFVVHLASALANFGREYQGRGLAIVAINANDAEGYPADSPSKMVDEVANRGYTFPYLYDAEQDVAKAYGAACTPDFFLFNADRELVYRGQFDGSRPGNDEPITGIDLRNAADAVLDGRGVAAQQVPSVGCNIKWRAGNAPDYFG